MMSEEQTVDVGEAGNTASPIVHKKRKRGDIAGNILGEGFVFDEHYHEKTGWSKEKRLSLEKKRLEIPSCLRRSQAWNEEMKERARQRIVAYNTMKKQKYKSAKVIRDTRYLVNENTKDVLVYTEILAKKQGFVDVGFIDPVEEDLRTVAIGRFEEIQKAKGK